MQVVSFTQAHASSPRCGNTLLVGSGWSNGCGISRKLFAHSSTQPQTGETTNPEISRGRPRLLSATGWEVLFSPTKEKNQGFLSSKWKLCGSEDRRHLVVPSNPHGPKSLPANSNPNPTWRCGSPSAPCIETLNAFLLLLGQRPRTSARSKSGPVRSGTWKHLPPSLLSPISPASRLSRGLILPPSPSFLRLQISAPASLPERPDEVGCPFYSPLTLCKAVI